MSNENRFTGQIFEERAIQHSVSETINSSASDEKHPNFQENQEETFFFSNSH